MVVTMQYIIQGYEPKKFFEHFEEISAIPRGSGNEKAISDFLVNFGKSLGLEVYQDEIWNVVIKKPGSKGAEDKPAVMLQGHMDMVCEKNSDVVHDFLRDGIELCVEDGRLHAKGTTLGADNGNAVAMMMTLLEDETLVHPPLECVFTVQEETGLTGAEKLDPALISARCLINMDSGGTGKATVSCAGGLFVNLAHPCGWEPNSGPALKISIRGLLGGHSGGEIHLGHVNSNKAMARILYMLSEKLDIRLCDIDGGSKDNAIPRECDAVVAFSSEQDLEDALVLIEAEAVDLFHENSMVEKDFHVNVEPVKAARSMSRSATDEIVKLLFLAPNGVKSRNVPAGDFVVSSLNMGVVKTLEDAVRVTFLPRSSVASLQEQTKKELVLFAQLFHCAVEMGAEYPGWSYTEHSAIREIFRETYRELTGGELVCESSHGGLECGLFSDKLNNLDAIAVGMDAADCHTPNESLDLASCGKFYELITRVLEKLAK